jgi:hypothetical protein
MSLPSLATIADVRDRAPDITLDDFQVAALLADASAIVRAYAGMTWVDSATGELSGVPDGVVGIVSSMVIRYLRAPEGIAEERIGNYSVNYASAYAAATDRLYLTKSDKAILRSVMSRGAFSIATHGVPGWLGS